MPQRKEVRRGRRDPWASLALFAPTIFLPNLLPSSLPPLLPLLLPSFVSSFPHRRLLPLSLPPNHLPSCSNIVCRHPRRTSSRRTLGQGRFARLSTLSLTTLAATQSSTILSSTNLTRPLSRQAISRSRVFQFQRRLLSCTSAIILNLQSLFSDPILDNPTSIEPTLTGLTASRVTHFPVRRSCNSTTISLCLRRDAEPVAYGLGRNTHR